MSSSTWTPAALSSDARPLAGAAWRLIEAQHRVSTMKLVDTVDEQTVLEALIEATKPTVPAECRHLHYLLSTPFRYGAPYPRGSRFRRAGMSDGVFYGSEAPRTAVAEMVFYRLLFFAESPATPWPANPAEFTAYSAEFNTARAIDLTAGRLAGDHALWRAVSDYAACQRLADAAREAAVDVIRYRSVRDPAGGFNLAILRCRAFSNPNPAAMQSWWIFLSSSGAQAMCEAPKAGYTFGRDAFAGDPRIAGLNWSR